MRSRLGFLSAMLPLLLIGCVCPPVPAGNAVRLACCQSGSDQPVNISTGVAGAGWTVRIPGATAPVTPVDLLPVPSAWVPAPSGSLVTSTSPTPRWDEYVPARWIVPPGEPQQGGEYLYQTQFEVPACLRGRTVRVKVRYAAAGPAPISVGRAAGQRVGTFGPRRENIVEFEEIIRNAPAGDYPLRVNVQSPGGPPALIVQAVVTTLCQ